MKNQRLIFVLFYEDGYFIQSRNFRRQRVGDIDWLKSTYGFANIANAVDELIILDLSQNSSRASRNRFLFDAATIGERFFAPIAVGGGINSLDDALAALRIGAEKIVINSALSIHPEMVKEISDSLGSQAIIGSVDFRLIHNQYTAYISNGSDALDIPITEYLVDILHLGVGELLINSIDRDGTGMGLDLGILDKLPEGCVAPVVLMGGAGTAEHLSEGLANPKVDGVATGNLFNFVGDGLPTARARLILGGRRLADFRTEASGAIELEPTNDDSVDQNR